MGQAGASISFMTEQEDEPILLVIETFTVGWLGSTQLQVSANGVLYPLLTLTPGNRRHYSLQITPQHGHVTLEFTPVGDISAGADPRKYLWLGIGSLGYALANDPLSRVALLEEYSYWRIRDPNSETTAISPPSGGDRALHASALG